MDSHRLRVIAILVAWAIVTIGLIVLVALGQTEGTGFGVVAGIEAALTPALVDALAVERRRRNPTTRAIKDDIGAVDSDTAG